MSSNLKTVNVKLVFLGEAATGKSSLMFRFVNNNFQETIGVDFLIKRCHIEDNEIKFEIWHPQKRFNSLAPTYYRGAQAAIVVYDVTKAATFDRAKSWVKELQRQVNPPKVIALVGNKIDLVQPYEDEEDEEGGEYGRQVPIEEAKAYALEAGLLFFETSAKKGDGVLDVFVEIAKIIKAYGTCTTCEKHNISPVWCQTCDPVKIAQGWSSGDEYIDKYIKELQLRTTNYEKIIEWIPFDKLTNLQKIRENESEELFMATWLDGIRKVENIEYSYKRSRITGCGVNFISLPRLNASEFMEKFKQYIQSNNSIVYGITKDSTTTNGYMIVIPDEFSSRRNESFGECKSCKHYNTSLSWCQACDPWKVTQNWTSGDQYIDEFIKELQLEATNYEEVIEWIQFDKLTNLQKIRENESEVLFMATWPDGIRKLETGKGYRRLRITGYGVNLKTLPSSQTRNLKFIKELEQYMQLSDSIVYGITKDTTTSGYMIVVPDEFNSIRNKFYGKCIYCKQYNTSLGWCQACDPWKATQNWTSGDKDIDKCIKKLQLEATNNEKVIEWIPFDQLTNLQKITEDESGVLFVATWLNGIWKGVKSECSYKQSRITGHVVNLISSPSLNASKFIKVLELLSDKIVGITKDSTATNGYMIVIPDKFSSKRNNFYGKCIYCKQYSTSFGWCQLCDYLKATQDWTSGDKDIDNCIKGLQFEATNYEKVIEWIPFDQLTNLQKIKENEFEVLFVATWLDGIRKVEKSECSYKQSRITGHVVNLMSLPSLNASEFIEKFKRYMQLSDSVIYGITKDSATINGYMIVIPDISSSHNTFFSWCQLCDHLKATQDWTSGDEYIDGSIREFQLKATNCKKVIEWIPFNKLTNLQKIREDESGVLFVATWLNGIRKVEKSECSYKQSCIIGHVVHLISLPSLNAWEFIEKLKQYMQLSDSIVYGITKDATASGYMIVVSDEFNSIRNEFFGECKYCRQHNTFFAWCQLCDPRKAVQDWTSGDEYIDECIKKLQLKTTNYEDIIEWIPFDKLQSIKENHEEIIEWIPFDKLQSIKGNRFVAIWSDGIRKVKNDDNLGYIQSRIQFYRVNLMEFGSSSNALDFIKNFENYMQSKSNELSIYGITRKTETNEYMIVFDDYKRNQSYGTCMHCKQYNTSSLWCQSCDPWKAIQGWELTSGDEDIDNCIKNFQLEAAAYDKVIEWIPFEKLQSIKGKQFVAIWSDGIRKVKNDVHLGYIQSRIQFYRVNLMEFGGSINALDFIKNFENYMQSKSNELTIYGITRKTETNEYMIVFDDYKRNESYGTCTHCKQYNTSPLWCQSCDPLKETQVWELTSGDEDIDNCIKEFQFEATAYDKVIEWIPFNRLEDLQKIGKGGFSTVYSAIWSDGKRTVLSCGDKMYRRYREASFEIALKSLSSSQKNSLGFLREFKNLMKCRLGGTELEIYGLTKNDKTDEYMMAIQYANRKNLREFLSKYFRKLLWQKKLRLLTDIAYNLSQIHKGGYIHGDMHSGNILIDQDLEGNVKPYISDLGLSKKIDEHDSGEIYGIIPYVAPEVLEGKMHTQAADIYGFGIIMTEMSTGKKPFDGYQFGDKLAVKICYDGLRPKLAPGIPDCYIELANQCMDSDAQKRPTAMDISKKLNEWLNKITGTDDTGKIKKAFLDANTQISTLFINMSQKHPDSMYTSKVINTNNVSKAIKDYSVSQKIEPEISDDL